mmetsp:Transcript_4923/g.10205  ORF Transcript_4923/g.10205 Transcript_4923/m.10205 type:complete len:674 (-) Transcript_4923:414-2435(-)|eukprot:CAMPEP_0171497606 /NCGR_PEP_ID=MMETSP0958-20121227/7368_1 /TAXON_ID=87120 /ORGANISM="Aurantiochytrium limacinum, Strain ATCCMYA-1381" /LENGTH=673 /DNA_ID=CAMNT_0012031873 /DNA_START=46 /DNA_END=2067 /DNA_ORIENTATION=+
MALEIGSRVKLPHLGDAMGTVRYVGPVHYSKGDDWVGVEMDDPVGKNNGTVKGTAYFVCDDKFGVFTRAASVQVQNKQQKQNISSQAALGQENRSVDEIKRAGNERFVAKDFEGAMLLYSEALQQDPCNSILRGNRAACFLELDDPDNALTDADTAIREQPSWWKAHMRRGKALKMLMDFEGAAQSLSKAAELVTDMQHRNELLKLAQECLQEAMQESTMTDMMPAEEPAWFDALPPEIAQQARSDPQFMQLLMEEMQNAEMEMGMDMGMNFGGEMGMPPMVPGMEGMPGMPGMADMDDMGAMMGMSMMGGSPGGIEKQRLKRPILLILPLHEAAKEGNVEELQKALQEGAEVAELDSHGRSALAWACLGGHLDAARVLIDAGAPVDPPIKEKTKAEVKASDDDEDDEDIAIPLHFAVRSGSKDVVDLLLERGARPLLQEPILGHNALHQAVKSGQTELVLHLLDRYGAELGDQEDLRGISPLCLACTVKYSGDRIELLREMLARNASVTAGVLYSVLTRVDDEKVLALLQSHTPNARIDASPALRNESGANLLHLAAKATPETEAVNQLKTFLEGGMAPFVNDVDDHGFSPLGVACQRKGYPGVLRVLVEAGADVNAAQGPSGDRPLHMVGSESNEQAWQTLLKFGADENALNNDGNPPKLRPNLADKCSIM